MASSPPSNGAPITFLRSGSAAPANGCGASGPGAWCSRPVRPSARSCSRTTIDRESCSRARPPPTSTATGSRRVGGRSCSPTTTVRGGPPSISWTPGSRSRPSWTCARSPGGRSRHAPRRRGSRCLPGMRWWIRRGAAPSGACAWHGLSGSGAVDFDCDLLAVSGGWNPNLHLHAQSGGRPRFDEARAASSPTAGAGRGGGGRLPRHVPPRRVRARGRAGRPRSGPRGRVPRCRGDLRPADRRRGDDRAGAGVDGSFAAPAAAPGPSSTCRTTRRPPTSSSRCARASSPSSTSSGTPCSGSAPTRGRPGT